MVSRCCGCLGVDWYRVVCSCMIGWLGLVGVLGLCWV